MAVDLEAQRQRAAAVKQTLLDVRGRRAEMELKIKEKAAANEKVRTAAALVPGETNCYWGVEILISRHASH